MKDSRCFICKYNQDNTPKAKDDLIYDAKGKCMSLPLCYSHSVELFKSGQRCFFTKHRNIFVGNFGSESDLELINYFPDQNKAKAWF